jgi:carbamoyltransferase
VHVDGTARPQVITDVSDPFMHALLHAWSRATRQMALINTSFNRHEEPIILSTDSAVEALREGIVDLVVLEEKFVLRRRPQ